MTRFHDVSNALGFGLGGLLGWEQRSRGERSGNESGPNRRGEKRRGRFGAAI